MIGNPDPSNTFEESVKGSVKVYLPNSRRFLILFARIRVFPQCVSLQELGFQPEKLKITCGSFKSVVFCEESARAAAATGRS